MVLEIKFKLNESLYTKDPQNTDLGKKILKHSIILLDEIGFERFTFKKLAAEINSVEKSIYRYFENKHLLLLFLTSWYWEWVHYLMEINTANIFDPKQKLDIALQNIVFATAENTSNEYINERLLHRVVISEGAKSYHTCTVDDENKEGLFLSYKSLVNVLAEIILAVKPDFNYAHSLASNIFEMANNQIYFAEHLPDLTSLNGSKACEKDLVEMLRLFTSKILN